MSPSAGGNDPMNSKPGNNTPLPAWNSRGFTYVALLCAIVIIGITLGTVTKYWSNVSLRDKEEELLFRGDQYRDAIVKYYYSIPERPEYPATLDDLMKDPRSISGKRYLRQKFKDPITGEDFVEIKNEAKRVIGVCSASEKQPLKVANFSDPYGEFEGKKKYNDWKFQFIAPQAEGNVFIRGRLRPGAGQPGIGQPGTGTGIGIGTGMGTGIGSGSQTGQQGTGQQGTLPPATGQPGPAQPVQPTYRDRLHPNK